MEHSPDFKLLFESIPGLYLVLNRDLTILAVSDAYCAATMTKREEILGRGIFEVFPDNPSDEKATGTTNLKASLESVLEHKVPNTMAVQKYDIRRPASEGSSFEVRYWSPVNYPLFKNGSREVAYIVHRVEDVTEFVKLKQLESEKNQLSEALKSKAGAMEAEIYLRAQQIQETNKQLRKANEELERREKERDKALEELRGSEERLRLLVEGVKDVAMFMLDPQGKVQSWNRGAEQLLGYREKEILGQHISCFYSLEDNREQLPEREIESARRNKRLENEGWKIRRDGSRFLADYILAPLFDKALALQGYCQIIRDITERKKVEEERSQAAIREKAALEASRYKSEFISHMGHEIRNPMNAIIGINEMLLDSPLEEEQREYLQLSKKAADSLLSIMNDILDLSKIESGKLSLESIEFDLPNLIRDKVNIFSHSFQKKGLDLKVDISQDLDTYYIGDPNRIGQILSNLVGNALKFTNQGGVTVKALPGPGPGTVKIEVTDTGIGIAPEAQEKLFHPFIQADPSTARKYGGTGLGLSICKKLVDLFKGQLGVDGRPGAGSTFWFTLPLKRARETPALKTPEGPPRPQKQKRTASPKSLQDARILIAEDNTMNQFIAIKKVEKMGFRVDAVNNGLEAILALKKTHYDLILMDVQMPEMDGYQATEKIRKGEEDLPSDIPILAITAHTMRGDQEKCLEVGMNDFIAKPISDEVLQAALFKWLSLDQNPAETENNKDMAGKAEQEPPTSEASYVDKETFNKLLEYSDGEGPEFVREMLDIFLKSVPGKVATMEDTIYSNNRSSLAMEAHSLKSNCAYLGAHTLAKICSNLEKVAKVGPWEEAKPLLKQFKEDYVFVKKELEKIAR